ncbi:MAG TPA: hypothetical protein VGJ60_34890 [Chloroflexota bacterium]|jgi:hypothetical protein
MFVGLALGFLGLPRIDWPRDTLPETGSEVSVPVASLPRTPQPTIAPQPLSTPTSLPTPVPPLFAASLNAAVPGWPNDRRGTAWFADGEYHLFAREPDHFVATGVPLAHRVGNAKLTATFHKVGGPAGGGYGLIVRDQGAAAERDGHNQSGEYIVLEVGDRGEIGIWQRDESHWIDIVPWTPSRAVHPDLALNSITVTTEGSRLDFAVNSVVVADVSYDRLPTAGAVGVFAGGDFNEVALQSLRIEP